MAARLTNALREALERGEGNALEGRAVADPRHAYLLQLADGGRVRRLEHVHVGAEDGDGGRGLLVLLGGRFVGGVGGGRPGVGVPGPSVWTALLMRGVRAAAPDTKPVRQRECL